jgi:hypothetical protein
MFGSTVLEVATGLALVFLTMSTLCSGIQEIIAGIFSWRAATLKLGIERMLGDPNLARKIQSHSLVTSFSGKAGSFPSYLPAGTFAVALLDELEKATTTAVAPAPAGPTGAVEVQTTASEVGGVAAFVATATTTTSPAMAAAATAAQATAAGVAQLAAIKEAIRRNHPGSPLVALLADRSIKNLDDARDAIARWFDEGMDRVSGWYKRRAQLITIAICVVAAVLIDVDAIAIGRAFAVSPTLRALVVASAESSAKAPPPPSTAARPFAQPSTDAAVAPAVDPLARMQEVDHQLQQLDLPLARWIDSRTGKLVGIVTWTSVLGWLITALAASLGAPFWFDALGKLVNLRAAGRPPAKTPPRSNPGAVS